ncbi:RNA-directed DNA polymerase [Oscillibacter sp.]|uniref:RNA-directed DNA polymerase n=1 Tax=Oscillibacter sp. TaxID=1945593 RepID=UPI00261EA907|nr:RNA-directed DNA polymerase [Oscillibacter sp.]MDD3347326.1 RNA-directed DNA polymerase [Oscillibacter sp.]
MKRYGHLWEQVCSIENLKLAHQHARKGKGWYEEVKEIDSDPNRYLANLQEMLLNHTFKTSSYETFTKQEGGKLRTIYKLPYFPDRVAQWAILQVIEPVLIKNLVSFTYSAIPNRGIHKALTDIKTAITKDAQGTRYCLKFDIRHYYQSIDHDILKTKYRTLFKDRDLLESLDEIIDSIDTADNDDLIRLQATAADHKGLPIGNYHSQYGGNFYLSSFDHWMKENKRIRHYFRYMDDVVILASSKEELHALKTEITEYLWTKLKLTLKPNWQVFPVSSRGIDFVGYRIFPGYTLLRKSTCIQMKRKMNGILAKLQHDGEMSYSEWCSVNSYHGWLIHCNGFRLSQKYLEPLRPYCDQYYLSKIKRKAG